VQHFGLGKGILVYISNKQWSSIHSQIFTRIEAKKHFLRVLALNCIETYSLLQMAKNYFSEPANV